MNSLRCKRSAPLAFTLIELLVVMAVIVVLMSLVIPLVVHSMHEAGRARTQADFQTISLALEAYKQDFGDYPRVPMDPTNVNATMHDTGAAVLGKALLGPYGDGLLPPATPGAIPTIVDSQDPPVWQNAVAYHPGDCVTDGGGVNFYVTLEENTGQSLTTPEYYAPFNPHDGADGPGFRTRTALTNPPTSFGIGKVWGPYLNPGKIKNEGVYLLDTFGGPILYFPARPAHVILSPGIVPPQGGDPYVDLPDASKPIIVQFNAYDNLQAFRRAVESPPSTSNDSAVLNRIQIMFGDWNHDGAVNSVLGVPNETPVALPFVLMSAGNDGFFGPRTLTDSTTGKDDFTDFKANQKAVQNCDDVTNFQ
jgi:prepilin-type N-terminal cleavage/methylation domain-containing protein